MKSHPLLRAQKSKARSPQRMGHPQYFWGQKRPRRKGGPPVQNSTTTTTNYLYSGANIIEELDASGNVIAGGNYYVTSKVELHYPYTFPFFSKVIRLVLPSSAFDGTVYIGNSATMEN